MEDWHIRTPSQNRRKDLKSISDLLHEVTFSYYGCWNALNYMCVSFPISGTLVYAILKLFFSSVWLLQGICHFPFSFPSMFHIQDFFLHHTASPNFASGVYSCACQLSELSTLFVACFLSLMTQIVCPRQLTSVDIKTTREKQIIWVHFFCWFYVK